MEGESEPAGTGGGQGGARETRARPSRPERKRRQYLPAEERRKVILEAARGVFARRGLQGARTRELAQAAGINQATLFEHFGSKEALFAAAVVQPLAELLEGARERAQSYAAADSTESLLNLLQTGMRQNLDSMVEIYPLLAQALFSDQATGVGFYREYIQPLLQVRAETMRQFIRSDMDPKLVQLASFGIFFAIAMDRAMSGEPADLGEHSRQLTDLILYGCARQHREN